MLQKIGSVFVIVFFITLLGLFLYPLNFDFQTFSFKGNYLTQLIKHHYNTDTQSETVSFRVFGFSENETIVAIHVGNKEFLTSETFVDQTVQGKIGKRYSHKDMWDGFSGYVDTFVSQKMDDRSLYQS